LGTVINFLADIHFNFIKEKIIVVDGFDIFSIKVDDLQYISIEELSKKKRNVFLSIFFDPINTMHLPSKYVYRNGKTFNIVFHMKKQGDIVLYYGWLYKTKSGERIQKQLQKFMLIKDEFFKHRKKED
jgi:hypothetical protein